MFTDIWFHEVLILAIRRGLLVECGPLSVDPLFELDVLCYFHFITNGSDVFVYLPFLEPFEQDGEEEVEKHPVGDKDLYDEECNSEDLVDIGA
jgi:hypothetical protein